jgi:hypothetical protein
MAALCPSCNAKMQQVSVTNHKCHICKLEWKLTAWQD